MTSSYCNIYEGEKKLVSYLQYILYDVRAICIVRKLPTHPEGALAPTPRGPWHPPRMGPRQNISRLAILDMQLAQAVKMGNADRKMVFLAPLERLVRVAHGQRSYPHYSLAPTVLTNLEFWQPEVLL